MGLMPERMTPKSWAAVAVAIVALGAGGYLIYDNMRDQGQAAPSAAPSAPAAPSVTIQPAPTQPGSGGGSGQGRVPVPAGSAGPRRTAPK
jgi:hypothetical protein